MGFFSFVLLLSFLSLASAQKCGEATLNVQPRGGSSVRISLGVIATEAPPSEFPRIQASVFWYNAAADKSGFLSTRGKSSVMTGVTYTFVWDVSTGDGLVQIGVPVLQADTSTTLCYAVFPTRVISVSTGPGAVVALPK